MTRLPLAVIGCGLIGMRHARIAHDSDRIDLTAVVESDDARRRELIAQGLPAVASVADVPGRTRAAIVATPTPDHANSGLAAIDRRWAVLVEKPLAGTLAEADALITASRRQGVPVITGHHRRCHPFVQATFARLERVGKPVAVQGMWSLRKHDSYYDPDWRRAPGSGPLMTNLSHEIDLMRGFLGDIDEVSALSSNATRGFVIEDTAAISIRFRNGALGSFLISDAGLSPWSFEAACGENPDVPISGQDYLRFTGTAGAMSFPSLMLWQGAGGKPATWHTQLEREACPSFDRIDPIAVQMDLFANLLEGRDSGILADGADGRATLEATLAAVLSAQMGRPVRQGEVPADYDGSSISEVT